MPTDFKNLIKLQQQQQLQNSFANESLFKPYYNNQTTSNVIMTETNNSDSAKNNNNNNRLCSEDDSNSNDSELSVGQEKVQQQSEKSIKESPHSDDDEMSNASSSQYTNSSTRLCSPQEIMRPTMQFHEEIIRSSQLYAEELLRQRIAAAARLQSGVSDAKCSPDEPEPSIISKLSFQSNLFNRAAASSTDNENGNNLFCAKSAINFQNIHSHLSSIAQITHSLGSSGGSGNHHMKKDDASLSSLSRESSQSPSGFQQFKLQQHNHHLLHHQQKLGFHTISTHQNQLHDHNLKFSIDNILKADFGRRITEPLLKSSKAKRSLRDGKHEKDKVNVYKSNSNNKINNSSSSVEGQGTSNDKSMDQSSTADNASRNSSGASSSATKTDSSGTVWPAWVSFYYLFLLCVIGVFLKVIQIEFFAH